MDIISQLTNCFEKDESEANAIAGYVGILLSLPAQIVQPKSEGTSVILTFAGIPFTATLALATGPVFLAARQAKIAAEKVMEMLNKSERNSKEVVEQKIKEGKTFQKHLTEETWKKAIRNAANELLIEKNKRLIVINERSQKRQVLSKNSDDEFMLVVDKDITVFDLIAILKKKLKNPSETLVLMHNQTILNSNQKIESISFNSLGVIRISYVSMETFG